MFINKICLFFTRRFQEIFSLLYVFVHYLKFKALTNKSENRFNLSFFNLYPCVFDKTENTGFARHYILHTAWAARVLKELNPDKHIDVSSSLMLFSIISAFIPVEFYDYRPAVINLSNLTPASADLLNLPFETNSIKSLSCMHVVEHVGLGRYGDRLDPGGDLKAISELKRVLAPDGTLLFVVPFCASPRIEFNAHRIYSYEQIKEYFSDLELVEFVLIPDSQKDGDLVYNPSEDLLAKQKLACGCFKFRKKAI